jgi:hypothetical protein
MKPFGGDGRINFIGRGAVFQYLIQGFLQRFLSEQLRLVFPAAVMFQLYIHCRWMLNQKLSESRLFHFLGYFRRIQ